MNAANATPLQALPAPTEIEPMSVVALENRWMLFANEPRMKPDGSTHYAKVPYYITGERRRGDLSQDAGRLVNYAEAKAARAIWGDRMAGLGFALGDGWQGIDFDKIDERPELAALVSTLPGYVELSPSLRGVHAIGRGASFTALGSNKSGIEAYCEGRFFTFTGFALSANPEHLARWGVVAPTPASGQTLADLAPYVTAELAPRHAAHRRAFAAQPAAPVEPTGQREIDELADALRYLDPDDRDTWIRVGQALCTLPEHGRPMWEAWSRTSQRFPGGDDLERFDTFSGERTSWQSVFTQAQAVGWKNPRKLDPAAIFAGSDLVAAPGMVAANAPRMAMPLPGAAPPPVPAERLGGQSFLDDEGKKRDAALHNVVDALGPSSGMLIAFDQFQGVTLIGTPAGLWEVISDLHYARFRETLGRGGFKPISPEVIHAAVDIVAANNAFDSANDWCRRLVWDGVPRIDGAMHRYFGAADTPYSRAVGAYLFTALAGRAIEPGCQADMAPVLVGEQGLGKTTAIAALAPTLGTFGEVNLSKTDDQIAYVLRGKLPMEIAEMRGIAGRDAESIRARLTRRVEEFREPYRRTTTRYARRCVFIGTANTAELLDDETGERRWLPLHVGQTDVPSLAADRDQLWAEGVARFIANGVEWRDAERLARAEHAAFKVSDEWTGLVEDWLARLPLARPGEMPSCVSNGDRSFSLVTVAAEAIGVRAADFSRPVQLRMGKILRALGYEKFTKSDSATSKKLWKKGSNFPSTTEGIAR